MMRKLLTAQHLARVRAGTQSSAVRAEVWAFSHSRTFSDSSDTQQTEPIAPSQRDAPGQAAVFEYEGPFAATVKRLKKLSLFSLACTTMGSPLLVSMDAAGAASTTLGGKVAIAATLSGFGAFTTGMLHWFTSPYVHRLRYDPSQGKCEATTLTLLGKEVVTQFRPEQVQLPRGLQPLSTFQVGDKTMYLDITHFGDKQLLARLTPEDPLMEQAMEAARNPYGVPQGGADNGGSAQQQSTAERGQQQGGADKGTSAQQQVTAETGQQQKGKQS